MDTKKFVLLISALTAVVCALTIVYNFASMPAYGDAEVSAVALYASSSYTAVYSSAAKVGSSGVPTSTKPVVSSKTLSSSQAPISAVYSSAAASRKPSAASSKSSGSKTNKATTSNPVNLNTATLEQLETVPYIGEKKAAAIIAYRNEHGAFKSVNDLDNVKGFGKKTIAKIAPYLTTTT